MVETMESPVAQDLKLEMTRVIRAPRARVFDAWTKPELLRQWIGKSDIHVMHAECNPTVGGAYRVEWASDASDCSVASEASAKTPAAWGVYKQIVPNELLVFTWRGDWGEMGDTLVTVRLRDVEGGTELTLLHEHFPNEQFRQRHNEGWTGSFNKMDKMLTA